MGKWFLALMVVAMPALSAADAFADLNSYCRVKNAGSGYYLAERFCSCLTEELRKTVTEKELTDYFGRPPSPEDLKVEEMGQRAAQTCREKVERELKAI